ncbi:ADCY5 cyclase, partial [Galbula dea]|nr:ADCY5 cyclase [Galbula dea]
AQEALNPEDEVDEFLSRAIDARSIDQLRKDHVKKFLLTFQTPELEKKVRVLPAQSCGPLCLLKFSLSWPHQHLCSPHLISTPWGPPSPLHPIPSIPWGPPSLSPSPQSLHIPSPWGPPGGEGRGLGGKGGTASPLLPPPQFACSRMSLRDCAAQELNITPEAVGPCQLRALNFSLGTSPGPCHRQGLACDFPEYFSYSVVLSLLACSVFLHISSIGKLLLMVAIEVTYLVLVEGPQATLFDNADLLVVANALFWVQVWGPLSFWGQVWDPLAGCRFGVPWLGAGLGSLEFLGAGLGSLGWVQVWGPLGFWGQATGEKEEMEELQAYNRRLLHNILPKDVAAHFLARERRNDELYYQSCECVAVMFASISNFSEFYVELEANNEGVECLRLLNEIIADFDEVLGGGR